MVFVFVGTKDILSVIEEGVQFDIDCTFEGKGGADGLALFDQFFIAFRAQLVIIVHEVVVEETFMNPGGVVVIKVLDEVVAADAFFCRDGNGRWLQCDACHRQFRGHKSR